MRGSMETSAADPVVAPAAGESTSAALGADASLGVILPAPPTGAEVVGDRSVQRDGGLREPASSDPPAPPAVPEHSAADILREIEAYRVQYPEPAAVVGNDSVPQDGDVFGSQHSLDFWASHAELAEKRERGDSLSNLLRGLRRNGAVVRRATDAAPTMWPYRV